MHSILYVLGLTNASGGWYLWWSGIFGDVSIFGAVVFFIVHHNCHTKGCWRLGHPTATGERICRTHRSA